MKFLSKNNTSEIFINELVYRSKKDNSSLNLKLLIEQKNFCAYTEKYIQGNDSTEVEHFNPSLKESDDYYNYYAAVTTANKYKKYKGASFFENLFFQNEVELKKRISFSNNIFFEIDEADIEARDFIDFLGLNHPKLYEERSSHVLIMKSCFSSPDYTIEKIKEHFILYKSHLSFITALNAAFNYDFMELLN